MRLLRPDSRRRPQPFATQGLLNFLLGRPGLCQPGGVPRPAVHAAVRRPTSRAPEWWNRRRARSAQELFEEAMTLDPQERATLMRLLIESLDAKSEEGVEDAWRVEVERRLAELDSDAVETVPWEALRARLYRR